MAAFCGESAPANLRRRGRTTGTSSRRKATSSDPARPSLAQPGPLAWVGAGREWARGREAADSFSPCCRNGFDMIQSQPLRSSFKLIISFTFSSLMFKSSVSSSFAWLHSPVIIIERMAASNVLVLVGRLLLLLESFLCPLCNFPFICYRSTLLPIVDEPRSIASDTHEPRSTTLSLPILRAPHSVLKGALSSAATTPCRNAEPSARPPALTADGALPALRHERDGNRGPGRSYSRYR